MAEGKLEIRPFHEADLDAVRQLYAEVWRDDMRDPRQDRMRFVETMDGPAVAMVAMEGDRCVAVYPIWPLPLHDGRSRVPGGQSIDSMTHPRHQGRGLFTRLGAEAYRLAAARGIEVLYGAPNAAVYPARRRNLDWATPGTIDTHVRPLGLRGAVPLGALGDAILRILPARRARAGIEIVEERPGDDEIAAILDEAPAERGLWRIARDPDWYRFRYQDAGHHDYRWTVLREGGRARAFAVWGLPLRGARGRFRRANLTDVVAPAAALRRLALAAALDGARRAGAHFMIAQSTWPALARDLRASGFMRLRRSPLIARTLGPHCHAANPFVAGAWGLLGADFDFV